MAEDERPVFLVDLDRTLLDTSAYTAKLWEHVARIIPGVDPAEELKKGLDGRFYTPAKNKQKYGCYSIETHLSDLLARLGQSPGDQQIQQILAQLDENFVKAEEFLYPKAVEIVSNLIQKGDTSIITFGHQYDQQAKLRRLPTLSELPGTGIIIIQDDKAQYITNNFQTKNDVWLIDDKVYEGLPDSCKPILIDHGGNTRTEYSKIPVVNDLSAAEEYIMNYYESN